MSAVETTDTSSVSFFQSVISSARTFLTKCRFILALAVVISLLVAPPVAFAQITKLVGNTGQVDDNAGKKLTVDYAQQFTTGSHAAGYIVTSLVLHFRNIPSNSNDRASFEAKIWGDSSGNPNSSDEKGTLTKPASLKTGLNTFTASGEIKLDGSKDYHVVIDLASGHASNESLQTTPSDNEDSGGLSGFSIANVFQQRSSSSTTESDWDPEGSSEAFEIELYGYEVSATKVNPTVTVSSSDPNNNVATGSNLTLYGSAYDQDGGSVTYAWTAFNVDADTKMRGTEVTDTVLSNKTSATATFSSTTWGLFDVVLTVTDDDTPAGTTSKTLRVRARNAESSDATLSALALTDGDGTALPLTPVFDSATADYTADIGDESSLKVTATLSQTIGKYVQYTLAKGNDVNTQVIDVVQNPVDGQEETFTGLVPGNNTLTIGVDSADGGSKTNYQVVVSKTAHNPVVTISPGDDANVPIGTAWELNVSATDPDGGDITSYAWAAAKADGTDVSGFGVCIMGPVCTTWYYTISGESGGFVDGDAITITATATDDEVTTGTDTVTLTAKTNVPPVAVITPSDAQTILTSSDLTLSSASSSDPDAWIRSRTWTAFSVASDGTETQDNTLITTAADNVTTVFSASSTGEYRVKLAIEDSSKDSTTVSLDITVADSLPPVASIDTTIPANVYTGQSLSLTGSATEPEDDDNTTFTFVWTAEDSGGSDVTASVLTTASNTSMTTFKAATAGTYTITLTATDDDGQTGSTTATVTVTANPAPVVSITPASPTTVAGTDLQLTAVVVDTTPLNGTYTYAWTAEDFFLTDVTATVLSDADTATPTFNATVGVDVRYEDFTVILTVTDEYGGVGTATATVRVSGNQVPVITLMPSGSVDLDAGKDLELLVSATDPEDDLPFTYRWTAVDSNDNDVTSTALSTVDTIDTTFNSTTLGAYTVKIAVFDSRSASSSKTVTVNVKAPLVLSTTSLTNVPEDGGTGEWTVKLREAPTSTVTVSIESGDPNTATVSPSTLTFTPSDWDVAQMVTATGVNDSVANATVRRSIVTHNVTGADFTSATAPSQIVSVSTVDDDIPGIKVSQATFSIDESGGMDSWTVQLNTQPSATVTVTLTNSMSGNATIMPAGPLMFTTENWNQRQMVTVTAVDDNYDNDMARTTTVTHMAAGGDYASVPTQMVTVTLIDDEERGVTITPTELTMLEGDEEGKTYTIKLHSQPFGTGTPQVSVTATVTLTSGMRELNYNDAAATSFTQMLDASNWKDGVDVTLKVPNQDTPAEDTVYTVTHTVSGADYASGVTAETVTVTIPGLSVTGTAENPTVSSLVPSNNMVMVPDDPSLMSAAGAIVNFRSSVSATAQVSISATTLPDEENLPPGYMLGDALVEISYTDGTVTEFIGMATICLPRPEGGRIYRWDEMESDWVMLIPPDDPADLPADLPDGYACGKVERFSVFAAGEAPSGSVAQARLAQLGRVMAGQVVDAVQNRLSASREAGFQATMAGQALPSFAESADVPDYSSTPQHDSGAGFTGAPRDWENTQIKSLTEQSLLSGSSFSVTDTFLGEGSVSVWGQVSITGFEGEGLDDGQMTSGFFGTDWSVDELTAGLALSLNRGKGTWTSDDEGEDFTSSVTGIHPYFGYELSNSLSVWGVAGYGEGDIDTTDGRETTSVDTDMLMVAGGTSGDLESPAFMPEDVSLSLNSDLQWVRMGTDTEDASASRLRVAVKAAWQMSAAQGGLLKPSAEVGLRLDGGDAETGFGLDIGGGVGWSDASRGVSAELRGRALLTHASDDLRERSISGSFGWDPNPASAEGANLTVSYTVGGSATGGTDKLFSRDTLSAVESIGDGLGNDRMEIRLGYGMPVWSGRFIGTPQTTFGYSDDARDVSLGLRIMQVDRSSVRGTGSLDLSVEARRSESASDGYRPEDEIVFQLRTQF